MTESYKGITLHQKARVLPADMDTPISLFMGMAGAGDGILLESAAVDGRWGRYSILACDMLLQISCQDGKLSLRVDDDRLSSLKELEGMPFTDGLKALMRCITIEAPEGFDLPAITRGLYGYFGFEMAGLFNKKLAAVMPASEAECQLVLPGTILVLDHLYNRLVQVSTGPFREVRSAHESSVYAAETAPSDAQILAEPCEEGFKSNVERIRRMLTQGEAIQVVPSVRFSVPYRGDAFTLYRRAAPLQRFSLHVLHALPRHHPLRLVSRSHGALPEGFPAALPLAGTRRRGHTPEEDMKFEKELLSDPKEKAEHVMLVDLGRNDLGRIAEKGTVRVERLMQIERFSHVMHMTKPGLGRAEERHGSRRRARCHFPRGHGIRGPQNQGHGNHP